MDDTFHFEYPSNKKSQPIMLKDAIETLENLKYTGLAASLKNYVENRKTYIKNHMGKYVQITESKIQVIDNIPVDTQEL